MTQRSALAIVLATLVVAACAAPRLDPSAGAPFSSDRITVETRGSGGADIVLVPGLASHPEVWAGVADSLDADYRLHLVQVRGFAGLPPAANAEGPVAAPVADEIARYIRERGLEAPTVIGHSMGGTIGMMLAARHPALVGRLMVVDMFPYPGAIFGPPNGTVEEVRRSADAFRAQILADTAGSPTGVLEQMFPTMTRVEAMRPMLLRGVRGTHRPTAANAFHELIVTDLRPELGRIQAPTTALYVYPTEIPLPPAEFDRVVAQSWANLPRLRLVRIDESNHFIQFDQPGRLLAEVRALMRMAPAR